MSTNFIEKQISDTISSTEIELFSSNAKGYGIRAKKNITAPASVIKEIPIVKVVKAECIKRVCSHCLVDFDSFENGHLNIVMQSCSVCNFIHYCSSACSKNDWNFHRYECELIQSASKHSLELLSSLNRLMGRIYIILTYFTDQNLKDNVKLYLNQLGNKSIASGMEKIVRSFQFYVKSAASIMGNIENVVTTININSFGIYTGDLNLVAIGLYQKSRYLNHSCLPNCCFVFYGDILSVRLLENVEKHKELTISYLDIGTSHKNRRRLLMDEYYFECVCPLCNAGLDMRGDWYGEEKQKYLYKKEELMYLTQKYKSVKSINIFACHEKLLNFVNQFKEFTMEEFLTATKLLEECIDSQLWDVASFLCKYLIPQIRYIYGSVHPVLGIHYLKSAKIFLAVGEYSIGFEYLNKCESILKLSMENEHKLLDAISRMRHYSLS